jgi:hypothetical protein
MAQSKHYSTSADGQESISSPSLSFYSVRIDRQTFQNDKVRAWVERHLPSGGEVLDACAGDSHSLFSHEQLHANDLAGGNVDSAVDVRCLSDEFESERFAAVLYDPPYGPELADRLYSGEFPGYHTAVKRELESVLEPGGVFIQLGFTGAGLSTAWGYGREAVAIFNQFGTQRDVIGVVDRHQPNSDTGKRECSNPWQAGSAVQETVTINHGNADTAGATDALEVRVDEVGSAVGSKPLEIQEVREQVSQRLEGRTLAALWTGRFKTAAWGKHHLIRNAGGVDGVNMDAFGCGEDPHATVPLSALDSESFDGLFDTILFVPPESYFSRCLFEDGENQGKLDSEARDAFDDLLCPGGAVVQVGHTATCMRGEDGYVKESVNCYLPQTEFESGRERTPRAVFVTISRKPGERTPGGACHEFKYQPCIHCGDRFPVSPETFRSGCPECGAVPDQFCVDPATGHLLRDRFHDARVALVENSHPHTVHCSESPDGTHTLARPERYQPLPGV